MHLVNVKVFQINILIVTQLTKFGWYAAFYDKNTFFREMRRYILEATNLLILCE